MNFEFLVCPRKTEVSLAELGAEGVDPKLLLHSTNRSKLICFLLIYYTIYYTDSQRVQKSLNIIFVRASMIGYTFNPTLRVKGKVEISEGNTT